MRTRECSDTESGWLPNAKLRVSAFPRLSIVLLASAFALGACSVGPDYERPSLEVPAKFKSAADADAPRPALGRDWWRLFGDPRLDALEAAAITANADIAAAVARVTEARAAAGIVEGQLFPVVTLDPSYQRSRSSANRPSGGGFQPSSASLNDLRVPLDMSYEVDVWGRVRRTLEAATALAQASADDLAVVQQTVAADVARNYFNLRGLDAQGGILGRNVEFFRRQIALTETQMRAGLVSQVDVLQARTQLESTVAQAIDVRRQRENLEHAIAILLGRPPSALTLTAAPLDLAPPAIPAGLPADLLRRRPDVAEAEQQLVAANAQVGVAKATFYPVLRLTGAAGFESVDVRHMFDWESRVWSFGPSISFPVFQGGALASNLAQVRARYEEAAASYRAHVLTAFREVEDALTDIHLRADGAAAQDRAVAAAREYLRLSELRYRQGLVNYLQVIDAERTLLSNELSSVQLLNQRLVSTVLLVKALGGGWDAEAPPRHP